MYKKNKLLLALAWVNSTTIYSFQRYAAFGTTATVIVDRYTVTKTITNHINAGVFAREQFWLEKLASCPYTPKLLQANPDLLSLTMTNVGEVINKRTIPRNWQQQIEQILSSLKKYGCKHNDISQGNILVKNGKLSLIDCWLGNNHQSVTWWYFASRHVSNWLSSAWQRWPSNFLCYDESSKGPIDSYTTKVTLSLGPI